jgi:hypothetical protein
MNIQTLVNRWVDANQVQIVNAIEAVLTAKAVNNLNRVTHAPIINMFMFPRTRTERRFTLVGLTEEDGSNIFFTPQEASEFSKLALRALNEVFAWYEGDFSIRRNQEFSIYVKFTEKEVA